MDNLNLFGEKDFDWREEWQDMPEFIQKKQRAFQQIMVNFTCEEDIYKFGEVIGQNITLNTRKIWFPFKDKEPYDKIYVDAE